MQTQPLFLYTPGSLATVLGPPIHLTPTEARFAIRPEITIRLENGRAVSWINAQSGRGGGRESLSRILGLPLPPVENPGRFSTGRAIR